MTRVAMCPFNPEEPLVSTFIFPKKEFVCMKCGRLFEWLQPLSADETDDLLEMADQRKAEWAALADGIIVVRSWRKDCAKCGVGGRQYHADHADVDELAAHHAAVARIAARFPQLEPRLA